LLNSTQLEQQPSQLLSSYKQHKAYILFISSLRSNYTKIKYDGCLQKYLKIITNTTLTSLDQVLAKSPKVIESEIIDHLIEMKNKGLSFSTLSVYVAAMHSFFSINDVSINIKKLSKFVGEQENKYEYRAYTHEEISKLLSLCDERGKTIVILLASTAMRVGAVPELKLKHLKRYNLADGSHIYRITVYANSKKSKHITFCTPECARILDEYLSYRNRIIPNNLNQNSETGEWGPPEAFLITRQFNMNNVPSSSSIFKRPMTAQGLRTYIVSRLKKMNLRSSWKSSENSNGYIASHKNELHPCHSFRIFAITQMQRARVDKTIREMMVDHHTGMDGVYYKASEEEMLFEYRKAIDLLSINKESKLNAKIKELEQLNHKNESYILKESLEKDSKINILLRKQEQFEQLIQSLIDSGLIKPNTG
jgi:integrase